MNITTLIENTKPEGTPFSIGHGLSLSHTVQPF